MRFTNALGERRRLHYFEEFDIARNAPSFALARVRQHGTPFVIIVQADGLICSIDRRPELRRLLNKIEFDSADRLPAALTRVLERHIANPPAHHAATVTIVSHDVVVGVVALEGRDTLYAVTLSNVNRGRILELARRRYSLTNRECELLDHVLTGESSAEISRLLTISVATVEWHTKRLLLKTDSQNRTQMASRVLGWLPDHT